MAVSQDGSVARWRPSDAQYEYIVSVVKHGADVSARCVARDIGVSPQVIRKWEKNEEFLRWRNQEIMRHLTLDIPVNTAYSMRVWLDKVTSESRQYTNSQGKKGKVPTKEEMELLLKVADRFNVSLHVPTEVQREVVIIQMAPARNNRNGDTIDGEIVDEGPPRIDFDQMRLRE